MKTELAVAALRNGTVIDRIPSDRVFEVVKILNLESASSPVTIGYNLPSKKLGTKAIVKVADVEYSDQIFNRIALIAPDAKINIIRDYEVAEKFPVVLPDKITGIVKCTNPKCITNNEPMATRFTVSRRHPETVICCDYCGALQHSDFEIKPT